MKIHFPNSLPISVPTFMDSLSKLKDLIDNILRMFGLCGSRIIPARKAANNAIQAKGMKKHFNNWIDIANYKFLKNPKMMLEMKKIAILEWKPLVLEIFGIIFSINFTEQFGSD